MLFSSPLFFLCFLPVVVVGYHLLCGRTPERYPLLFLLGASFFFYSVWNPGQLALLATSIAFNYLVGRGILILSSTGRRRKCLLALGIIVNLVPLAYYKYFNYLALCFNRFLGLVGDMETVGGWQVAQHDLALPLAISFFTFQQIAYLVDAYRQETGEMGLGRYALFVSFFPQLIAGPIVRYNEMMPQIARLGAGGPNWKGIYTGMVFFAVGFAKKIVVADTLAIYADATFAQPTDLHLLQAWLGILSYTLQLYFDFSGYCDMAIGIGKMLGVDLPINFDSPYKSLNIREFWRRWHITLSRWLRDYIYIPLGGNRRGISRTYVNLMLTFLIGGVWHGAGATFVLWGLMHGLALVIHRAWERAGMVMPRLAAWAITFFFLNVGWTVFRATSLRNALAMLRVAGGSAGDVMVTTSDLLQPGAYVVLALLIATCFPNIAEYLSRESGEKAFFTTYRFASAVSLLFAFAFIKSVTIVTSPFLYFNF